MNRNLPYRRKRRDNLAVVETELNRKEQKQKATYLKVLSSEMDLAEIRLIR